MQSANFDYPGNGPGATTYTDSGQTFVKNVYRPTLVGSSAGAKHWTPQYSHINPKGTLPMLWTPNYSEAVNPHAEYWKAKAESMIMGCFNKSKAGTGDPFYDWGYAQLIPKSIESMMMSQSKAFAVASEKFAAVGQVQLNSVGGFSPFKYKGLKLTANVPFDDMTSLFGSVFSKPGGPEAIPSDDKTAAIFGLGKLPSASPNLYFRAVRVVPQLPKGVFSNTAQVSLSIRATFGW